MTASGFGMAKNIFLGNTMYVHTSLHMRLEYMHLLMHSDLKAMILISVVIVFDPGRVERDVFWRRYYTSTL